jgi:hypothetical protein
MTVRVNVEAPTQRPAVGAVKPKANRGCAPGVDR